MDILRFKKVGHKLKKRPNFKKGHFTIWIIELLYYFRSANVFQTFVYGKKTPLFPKDTLRLLVGCNACPWQVIQCICYADFLIDQAV